MFFLSFHVSSDPFLIFFRSVENRPVRPFSVWYFSTDPVFCHRKRSKKQKTGANAEQISAHPPPVLSDLPIRSNAVDQKRHGQSEAMQSIGSSSVRQHPLQHIGHFFHRNDFQLFLYLVCHILQVVLVFIRDENLRDAGALGCHQFFRKAADGA